MPFTFRRLTPADVPLFHAWLQRPHVAEWWGNQGTVEELAAEYAPTFTPDAPDRAYLALLDGAAVGFIQSYTVMGSPDGWWPDETDPGARGIDQFLADGARLGQGLGTAMVRAFVETLFADPAVTKVQTDPDPNNARAIRCYEKAGFRRVGAVETPDGRALLMVVERQRQDLAQDDRR